MDRATFGYQKGCKIRAVDAQALVRAFRRSGSTNRLDFRLPAVGESLTLDASDISSLIIGSVGGDLRIVGDRYRVVELGGHIYGKVEIGVKGLRRLVVGRGEFSIETGKGTIDHGLTLYGSDAVDVLVTSQSEVRDTLHLHCRAREVVIRGSAGKVVLCEQANVESNVWIEGDVHRVWIFTTARVGGSLMLVGRVGSIDAGAGYVAKSVMLLTDNRLEVESLRLRVGDEIRLNHNVSLRSCDIGSIYDIRKLRLVGGSHFATKSGRVIIADDNSLVPPNELATTYRSLRTIAAETHDRTLVSDLYYREMRARQSAALASPSLRSKLEGSILAVYRSMSSYGTRGIFPLLWLGATVVLGCVLFSLEGVDLRPSYQVWHGDWLGRWPWQDVQRLGQFTLRSMVWFVSPPRANLTLYEDGLQLLLRVSGVFFIAQFALALRERVAR